MTHVEFSFNSFTHAHAHPFTHAHDFIYLFFTHVTCVNLNNQNTFVIKSV